VNPIDPRVHPSLVPEGSKAVIVAEHQPEFIPLPSVRTPAVFEDGALKVMPYIITRWELSDEERKKIMMGEDVFITLVTSGPVTPLFVTVGPTDWTR